MNAIAFEKWQGLGNDFALVAEWDLSSATDWAALAKKLADRRRGIGYDQLLILTRGADGASPGFRVRNADGSPAAQCGNGARCVAAWWSQVQATLGDAFVLDGPSGPLPAARTASGWQIGMEVPKLNADISAWQDQVPASVMVAGHRIGFDVVEIGNPHAIVTEWEGLDAVAVVAALQADKRFADGVNVGLVEVIDRQRIALRTCERGSGWTDACGSNACAAGVALIANDRVDAELDVSMPGGKLRVSWQGEGQRVFQAGAATKVFEGLVRL